MQGHGQVNSDYGRGLSPQPAPPATLNTAIERAGELVKRLQDLGGRTSELATAIGGPFPVGGESEQERGAGGAPNMSAMQLLNNHISEAHRRAGVLEQCLAAMSRSLSA